MKLRYGQDKYLRWCDQDQAAAHARMVEACLEAHVSYELWRSVALRNLRTGALLFLACWLSYEMKIALVVLSVLLGQAFIAHYRYVKASEEAIALMEHPVAQEDCR